MKLFTRKLYDIINEEGDNEEHFVEYHIDFKGKNCLPLVLIFKLFYVRKMTYADVIFRI